MKCRKNEEGKRDLMRLLSWGWSSVLKTCPKAFLLTLFTFPSFLFLRKKMKLRFASKNADEIYNYLPRGPGVAAHRPAKRRIHLVLFPHFWSIFIAWADLLTADIAILIDKNIFYLIWDEREESYRAAVLHDVWNQRLQTSQPLQAAQSTLYIMWGKLKLNDVQWIDRSTRY